MTSPVTSVTPSSSEAPLTVPSSRYSRSTLFSDGKEVHNQIAMTWSCGFRRFRIFREFLGVFHELSFPFLPGLDNNVINLAGDQEGEAEYFCRWSQHVTTADLSGHSASWMVDVGGGPLCCGVFDRNMWGDLLIAGPYRVLPPKERERESVRTEREIHMCIYICRYWIRGIFSIF